MAKEERTPSVPPSIFNGLRKGKDAKKSKQSIVPSFSPSSILSVHPTPAPSVTTFEPSYPIIPETQKPTSNPSQKRRFKKVNKTTSTSVTFVPMDSEMDATTTSIYELVAKHFILDTLQAPKGMKIRVTSVEVQGQYLHQEELPSTRLLRQSDLSVMMDISGSIGFTRLGPNSAFEDAVLNGLRNNWTIFIDRLAVASPFFEPLKEHNLLVAVNERAEEIPQTGNIRIKPHDIVMLLSFSFVVAAGIICLVRHRRRKF